jgi:hypothetical protein
MLTLSKNLYIDLDKHLPLETLPDIHQAIADSYNLIKQNTWQRTTTLNGEMSNCNWQSKASKATETSEFFAIEVKNKTVAPMWILDLTEDLNQNSTNLYDSIENSPEDWSNIRFRKDLPISWDPFIDWIKNLDCFDRVGRTSLLLARPGIPTQYHRDIGVSEEDFTPYSHRQEFIWLKVTKEKNSFYT